MKTIKQELEEQEHHRKAISRGVKNWWERRRQRELEQSVKPIDWEGKK